MSAPCTPSTGVGDEAVHAFNTGLLVLAFFTVFATVGAFLEIFVVESTQFTAVTFTILFIIGW